MEKMPSDVHCFNDAYFANESKNEEKDCPLSKLSEIVDEGKIGEMITWMHAPGARESEK